MSPDLLPRLKAFWDADAETYDRSPGHAVADPAEAAAWQAAMLRNLPPPPARVLDAGAGTGAMALLAADLGYRVTALDLSPAMLDRARTKSETRGLTIEFVVGPADEPPEGPFEAIIERHLVWTLQDPVHALRAWRAVAPRVVLFEGLWGLRGPVHTVRGAATRVVRRAYGIGDDHHADYDPDVRARLPLAGGLSPGLLVDVARDARWRRYRVERLREVEAARRRATRWPLGSLESIPRFAMVLE